MEKLLGVVLQPGKNPSQNLVFPLTNTYPHACRNIPQTVSAETAAAAAAALDTCHGFYMQLSDTTHRVTSD